jgi:RNA recognition motif-containing protein
MEHLISEEQNDPYNLQVKQALIQEYRKISYIIEAAEVRERYLEISPLTESMWLEWMEDLPSASLYERALKDFYCKYYLDPKVLSMYVINADKDQVYQIFQKTKEYCRDTDYWLGYITRLDSHDDIRSVYMELFSIPRPGLDKAWKVYELWEKSLEIKEKTKEIYLKAFADWILEEESYKSLLNSDRYSISQLKSYFQTIKNSQRTYVFEEILTKFPKNSEIWFDYIIYTLPEKSKVLNICKRSIRNCYWDTNLWSYLFISYEQLGKSIHSNRYTEKFFKAILNSFTEASDYTRLWKEYSQNVNRSGGDHLSVLIEGETWLKEYFPPQHLVLKAYRASITNDVNLFEEIVKEKGSSASVWEVYLKYLEEKKDKSIRQVYKRALEYTKDNPKLIAEKYIDWENRYGNIQDIIQCRLKAYKRLMNDVQPAVAKAEKFKMKPKQVATRYTGFISNLSLNLKEHQLEEIIGQVTKVKAVRIVRDRKGNSRGIAYCDFESEDNLLQAVNYFNKKEIYGNVINMDVSKPPEDHSNDAFTLFVNNLPFDITENEIFESLQIFGNVKSVRIIKSTDGKCKGYAYVEYFTEESVELACEKHQIVIKNRKVLLQKFVNEKDQKFILHVSNLPYTIEESEVLNLFKGAITVNIPKDKLGKSRGFGFVEFITEADAQEVLENENPTLEGRHLVIKRSYNKPSQKKPLSNSDFKQFLE